MKKYLPLILPFVLFKLLIHWFGNQKYGFHRDELLHLTAGQHLDWGYFEFPPFIAFLGKLSDLFFDNSLFGTRLFPTLAGIAILLLCVAMALEMGGKKKAVLLSGIAVLAFLPFYRNHTLFQPVAFDQLFWTAGFYLIIKILNSKRKQYFLFLGLVAGLGLLNKYTMLVWGIGIAVALLGVNRAALYKSKWLYLSGVIALLVFLPNIIWQARHGFPLFGHMAELKASQLSERSYWDFITGQIDPILTLPITLAGIVGVLFTPQLRKYRALGIAFLIIFFTMWALKAKAYYFFAAYPVIFSAGAVTLEHWLSKAHIITYVLAGGMLILSLFIIPQMTPILPINTYTAWYEIEPENGRYPLTGDYADMFGWKEQVALVDSVYRSLPDSIQQETVLWAENYGEAGALQILGKKYGLPAPISRHGSFWYWGYGNPYAKAWISIGNEAESVHHVFENCTQVKQIYHPYAIGEENNIPLYLCDTPKVDIEIWWADYEDHIFD